MNEQKQSKTSQARRAANQKYNTKTYAYVTTAIPIESKPMLQTAASEVNQSVNGYVNQAITERLEREGYDTSLFRLGGKSGNAITVDNQIERDKEKKN